MNSPQLCTKNFIVEIGTEELPPNALLNLAESFSASMQQQLTAQHFNYQSAKLFATPRRIALLITELQIQQPDSEEQKLGPPIKAAYDANNSPTKVAQGFARSHNCDVKELLQVETPKGPRIALNIHHSGKVVNELLPDMVSHALQQLPIPKRMRWGKSRIEFIRPLHWLVMMLDNDIIECNILGLDSDRLSYGHRFHHPQAIRLENAADYQQALQNAYVIADFTQRRESIRQQVEALAQSLNAQAKIDSQLLDEVCSLVEYPVALAGQFDQEFLSVPAEALISSMQEHQKYFPVVDNNGQLLAHFITIANIKSRQQNTVIAGNERVIRPRLADAAFFFNTDKKKTLIERVDDLKHVVFQQQLGSIHDKALRIQQLSEYLAQQLNQDSSLIKRAALLCKADLTTDMVHEFSHLQGIAGYYYALDSAEPTAIAEAIKEHYLPKFSGDALPQSSPGTLLAVADRIDTLVGIFAINQIPTGSKDPFALRRASLSVLRLIIEKELDIDLLPLITKASSLFPAPLNSDDNIKQVLHYILDRLPAWYEEQGIDTNIYLAVAAKHLSQPTDIDRRIRAVQIFSKLEAANSLAAANKRVSNILSKSPPTSLEVDQQLLQSDAEKILYSALDNATQDVKPLLESRDYEAILLRLSKLHQNIDLFFEQTMVMVEDTMLRNNRLALLSQINVLFSHVADISLLATKQSA